MLIIKDLTTKKYVVTSVTSKNFPMHARERFFFFRAYRPLLLLVTLVTLLKISVTRIISTVLCNQKCNQCVTKKLFTGYTLRKPAQYHTNLTTLSNL